MAQGMLQLDVASSQFFAALTCLLDHWGISYVDLEGIDKWRNVAIVVDARHYTVVDDEQDLIIYLYYLSLQTMRN